MKKIVSVVLSLVMVLGCVGFTAFADETCEHDWSYKSILNLGTHYKSCGVEGCGEKTIEACDGCSLTGGCTLCGSELKGIHLDKNFDKVCDVCEIPINLNVEPELKHDENGHWFEVEVSGEIMKLLESEHVWGDWVVTVEPDCENAGEQSHECTVCKRVAVEAIEKLGHEWDDGVETKAPTCEDKGELTYTCVRGCTEVAAIDELKHDYEGTVTKAATCTEKGLMTYVCKNDETHTYTEDIEALDHTWGEWKVELEPTMKAEGKKVRECTVEGCDGKEEAVIEKLPHTCAPAQKLKDVKEATCTKDGYTGDQVCQVCEKVLKSGEIVTATGHDTKNVKIKDKKEAKCREDGYTGDEVCPICEEVLKKGEAIKKLGHDYDEKGLCKRCKHDKDTPETGDTTSALLMAGLMAMSGTGMGAMVYTNKKKAKKASK